MSPVAKTTLLLSSLASCLVLAGGASGAARSSPSAWLAVYCGSTLVWDQAVQTDTATLQKGLKGVDAADVGSVRGAFLRYLATVSAATRRVASELEAAGTPRLAHGTQIERIVSTGFARLAAQMAAVVKSSRSFSDDPATFARQAAAAGTRIHDDEDALGTTIQAMGRYVSPAFNSAGHKVAACRKLGA
jgi:hypothetical protein